jgi:hypothetical protein
MAQEDESEEEQVLLMVTTKTTPDSESDWYLDTGCSNHMTGQKKWFSKLDESIKSDVKFADHTTIIAEGVGDVMIHGKDGKKSYISNVLYVPRMKINLLSLGKLLGKGNTMKMENMHMNVFDNKHQLILKAPMSKNKTFKVEIQAGESKCLEATMMNDDWIWHKRYGHLNFKSLKELSRLEWYLDYLTCQHQILSVRIV